MLTKYKNEINSNSLGKPAHLLEFYSFLTAFYTSSYTLPLGDRINITIINITVKLKLNEECQRAKSCYKCEILHKF